ncbi:MAG: branched-chain amino acid ABC transporter permease [Acidiferrobacterales bacterium]
MNANTKKLTGYAALLLFGIVAPFLFPAYTFQLAVLWIMILFALTWDIMGGQMGYNSLGNIFFFGAGMYIAAIVQVAWVAYPEYSVAQYTAHFGAAKIEFSDEQYYAGLYVGLIAAAIGCVIFAVVLGRIVFGLRGPYFAIGTLGVALAAGELVGTWEWVGGGGGIAMPVYPGEPDDRARLFYYMCFVLAVLTFVSLKWLYSKRFGHAINAIRDDEEKAEGMGIHTLRYKTIAWSVAAFFLGMSGAVFGNMTGFIEPLEVAFATVTFGIFMVVMALLGGKGTLWGPVIGATVFHVFKEATWTYMLGWQWVALGALIIVNIVFFQQGILGWAMDKWPERFGIVVDRSRAAGEQETR